ncbi:MAG: ABC transporter ATP-binding protein [Anaerolineales bacterium]|nr:ABC transporter ATP-binding protein [Anaerolineales bacterium]
MSTAILLENVTKTVELGDQRLPIIKGISLEVARGEILGIIGPSGSGKSTLLGLLGGLDTPTTGRVVIDGIDISNMSEQRLTHIRNERIGFVFQLFHLIPTLTAVQNVALPIRFAEKRKYNPNQRAIELLTMLGLEHRLKHRPSQLSGGQQQRVAIARALANDPPILLCDEPTGNLDTVSGQQVLDSLKDIRERLQTTIIIVTHDLSIANQTDRTVTLEDGVLLEKNRII